MTHSKEIRIKHSLAEAIAHYLKTEPKSEAECLGEDETITCSVLFDDGRQMDIKCCGVQWRENENNLAWSEAVLFDQHGYELCCSDVSDDFLGEWTLKYGDDIYIANVVLER